MALGLVAVASVLAGLTAAVFAWSGATLVADGTALARVKVEPLGGTLVAARAVGPDGRMIPLSVRTGRLTPKVQLTPGERVSVEAVVRRPGWLAWALGSKRRERLTLQAPVAQLSGRWLTVPRGSPVRIRFDQPVSVVAEGEAGRLS